MTWFILLIPWIVVHGIKFQDKIDWPPPGSFLDSYWPQFKEAFVRSVLDSSGARFKRSLALSTMNSTGCRCEFDPGQQIISEPYDCACCESGASQCGYPMHNKCKYDSEETGEGCPGNYNKLISKNLLFFE